MNISTGKSPILIGLLSIVLSAQAFAQGNSNLESDDDKIAYSIGVNIGQNLQAQGILDGIEIETFVAGMLDAVADNVQMSDEDMFAAIQLFQQQMAEQQQSALAASTAASVDFLNANSAKEGVVTLESGLQYMVLESGPEGSASPTRKRFGSGALSRDSDRWHSVRQFRRSW